MRHFVRFSAPEVVSESPPERFRVRFGGRPWGDPLAPPQPRAVELGDERPETHAVALALRVGAKGRLAIPPHRREHPTLGGHTNGRVFVVERRERAAGRRIVSPAFDPEIDRRTLDVPTRAPGGSPSSVPW
jgi:hypothetical protein